MERNAPQVTGSGGMPFIQLQQPSPALEPSSR